MNDDWLDTGEEKQTVGLPAVVAIPTDLTERVRVVEDCWSRLTLKQKTFLTAWRENRFNARAAARALGLSSETKPMAGGMHNPDFATVVQIWRGSAANEALDRDRLLARQDDIVETLLTPKPILHQGLPVHDLRDPTGRAYLEEVEAGAASRANEVLMQAAGILKSGKDVEVNVGVSVQVGPPTLNIQVMPLPPSKAKRDESVVIDAKFTEVPSDEWLDA